MSTEFGVTALLLGTLYAAFGAWLAARERGAGARSLAEEAAALARRHRR